MKTSEHSPRNRRLSHWDYSNNGLYFVTFCTANRASFLGAIDSDDSNVAIEAAFRPSRIGEICEDAIKKVETLFEGATIDSFVIMPNHIHLLIAIDRSKISDTSTDQAIKSMKVVPQIVARIKSTVTKQSRAESLEFRVWQESYHDHIVRNEAELRRIREYIEQNPLKWALDKFYRE